VGQAFRGLAKKPRQATIGHVGRSHAFACPRVPRQLGGFRRLRLADERGVALVEFALVLPLVLVLLLGMIDVGKAVNYWNDETHLANEAARFAAVNKNPGPLVTLNQSIKDQADSNELKNGGPSISLPGGASGGVSICIWFPNNTVTTDDPARDHEVGDPVQVVVKAQYNWLRFLLGRSIGANSVLTATSTMRLEQPYTTGASAPYTTGASKTDASGTC
jgi:Flp pilus assembly protein TadG